MITMLDIAKRTNSDTTIGLVEEVVDYAPELTVFPMRNPLAGTTYKATRRLSLPQGGFRNPGEGATPGSSTYEQFVAQCFFLDYQLELDEAKASADDGSLGDLLTQETSGALMQMGLNIGQQIYYGTTADAKGFIGFSAMVDSGMVVDAGGDGNDCTSAWLVWFDHQGVELVPGGGMLPGLTHTGRWPTQQITDGNGKKMMAHVNNLRGWLGLAMNHTRALGRIHSIDRAASKPLTDKLGAELKAKFPVFMRNSGSLRWLMNSSHAGLTLQESRSAIGAVAADGGGHAAYAPEPSSLAGIPIIYTDSIANDEAAL